MPRISLVGDGHGGLEDYATLSLWWAAESGIDYGSPIEASCLGDCGTNFTLSGVAANGVPKIYTLGQTYDGTLASRNQLALVKRVTLNAIIDIYDMRGSSNSAFVPTLVLSGGSVGSAYERLSLDHPNASGVDVIVVSTSASGSVLRNSDLNGGANGIDFGFNRILDCTNVIIFNVQSDGFDGSGSNGTQTNCFAFNNGRDYSGTTKVNCASEDTTGSTGWTGYTSTELVDFTGGDYRTKSTSDLADDGSGGFIGAFLEESTSEITGNLSATLPSLVFSGGATDSTSEITGNLSATLPSLVFSGSALNGETPTPHKFYNVNLNDNSYTISLNQINFTINI